MTPRRRKCLLLTWCGWQVIKKTDGRSASGSTEASTTTDWFSTSKTHSYAKSLSWITRRHKSSKKYEQDINPSLLYEVIQNISQCLRRMKIYAFVFTTWNRSRCWPTNVIFLSTLTGSREESWTFSTHGHSWSHKSENVKISNICPAWEPWQHAGTIMRFTEPFLVSQTKRWVGRESIHEYNTHLLIW